MNIVFTLALVIIGSIILSNAGATHLGWHVAWGLIAGIIFSLNYPIGKRK